MNLLAYINKMAAFNSNFPLPNKPASLQNSWAREVLQLQKKEISLPMI